MKDPVQLGVVGRPKGIKGEFFVSGRNEPLPVDLKFIWVGANPASSQRYEVSYLKQDTKRPLLKLKECADRTAIEQLTLSKIWVDKNSIPIEDDEFFLEDLIDQDVIDSTGSKVGKVHSTYNFGASDCIEIRNDKRKLNLPLIGDYFKLDSFGTDQVQLQYPSDFFEDLWD